MWEIRAFIWSSPAADRDCSESFTQAPLAGPALSPPFPITYPLRERTMPLRRRFSETSSASNSPVERSESVCWAKPEASPRKESCSVNSWYRSADGPSPRAVSSSWIAANRRAISSTLLTVHLRSRSPATTSVGPPAQRCQRTRSQTSRQHTSVVLCQAQKPSREARLHPVTHMCPHVRVRGTPSSRSCDRPCPRSDLSILNYRFVREELRQETPGTSGSRADHPRTPTRTVVCGHALSRNNPPTNPVQTPWRNMHIPA